MQTIEEIFFDCEWDGAPAVYVVPKQRYASLEYDMKPSGSVLSEDGLTAVNALFTEYYESRNVKKKTIEVRPEHGLLKILKKDSEKMKEQLSEVVMDNTYWTKEDAASD
ncbi:MAG TPA: hypothetical protein ENN30_01060 [Candidatus Woesearchaeota archaeon]|mgnify:CR=1 FL=1|nr:hypothetical protein [Candidatus Woesearchaeota archaeon]